MLLVLVEHTSSESLMVSSVLPFPSSPSTVSQLLFRMLSRKVHIHLFIYLFIYLFIRLFVYLYIFIYSFVSCFLTYLLTFFYLFICLFVVFSSIIRACSGCCFFLLFGWLPCRQGWAPSWRNWSQLLQRRDIMGVYIKSCHNFCFHFIWICIVLYLWMCWYAVLWISFSIFSRLFIP